MAADGRSETARPAAFGGGDDGVRDEAEGVTTGSPAVTTHLGGDCTCSLCDIISIASAGIGGRKPGR